jgi:hypothetical protein
MTHCLTLRVTLFPCLHLRYLVDVQGRAISRHELSAPELTEGFSEHCIYLHYCLRFLPMDSVA